LELADLGSGRRVGFLEERPDPWFDVLPAVELAVLVPVLETEALHDVLIGWDRNASLSETEALHDVLLGQLVCVEVETVKDLQRLLRVAVRRVSHPTAWLHLVRVQTPEVQFFLEQRTTHVGRVVQLPGPVVVEYLSYSGTERCCSLVHNKLLIAI